MPASSSSTRTAADPGCVSKRQSERHEKNRPRRGQPMIATSNCSATGQYSSPDLRQLVGCQGPRGSGSNKRELTPPNKLAANPPKIHEQNAKLNSRATRRLPEIRPASHNRYVTLTSA